MPYMMTYSGYEYDEPEENNDEVRIPHCPRCGSNLLYDGDVHHLWDGKEGEVWRCEHCDYVIDIVD